MKYENVYLREYATPREARIGINEYNAKILHISRGFFLLMPPKNASIDVKKGSGKSLNPLLCISDSHAAKAAALCLIFVVHPGKYQQ